MKIFAIVVLAVAAAQGAVVHRVQDPLVNLPIYAELMKNVIPVENDAKIVGGQEAVPNSSPWQVIVSSNLGFCGGSLIKPDVVLTAAHCVDGRISSLDIIAGAHDRTNTADPNRQVWSCNAVPDCNGKYIQHDQWNPNNLNADVAIIRLDTPFQINDFVQTIQLAPLSEQPDMYVNQIMTVTGWGRTSDSSSAISNVLRTVDVPGISTNDCAAVYGNVITNGIVCASTEGGKGTCNGDSGGPVTMVTNGVRTQIGLVSFGASAGCEAGFPVGFSNIALYRDWIDANSA